MIHRVAACGKTVRTNFHEYQVSFNRMRQWLILSDIVCHAERGEEIIVIVFAGIVRHRVTVEFIVACFAPMAVCVFAPRVFVIFVVIIDVRYGRCRFCPRVSWLIWYPLAMAQLALIVWPLS